MKRIQVVNLKKGKLASSTYEVLFFIITVLLLAALLIGFFNSPKFTFFSIAESSELLEIPTLQEGTEVEALGYKFSKNNGIIVSTEPYVSCEWKSPEDDNGQKICKAIFEIEGLGDESAFLEDPEVVLDFANKESIKNLEITYSQNYEVIYEDLVKFEEEEIKLIEPSLEDPIKTSNFLTGNVVNLLEKTSPKEKRKGSSRLKSMAKNIRIAVAPKKTKIKKRDFKNFFEITETKEQVDEIKINLILSEEEGANNSSNETNGQALSGEGSEGKGLNEEGNGDSSVNVAEKPTEEPPIPKTSEDSSEQQIEEESLGGGEFGEEISEEPPIPKTSEEQLVEEPLELEEETEDQIEEETFNEPFVSEVSPATEEEVSTLSKVSETQAITAKVVQYLKENNILDSSHPLRAKITYELSKLLNAENAIDISKPFAVKVTFEIPKYETNSFNFELRDAGYAAKIDPEISGCGTLNSPNTVYILEDDLSTSGTCFNILAENVTLDCNGYQIVHSIDTIGYGIFSNADYTTIQNCNIAGGNPGLEYVYGIFLSEANYAQVTNNTIQDIGSLGAGIYFETSSHNYIHQNNFTSETNGAGAYLYSESINNTLYNNTFLSSGVEGHGINLYQDSSSNTIQSNVIETTGDSSHGIIIVNSGSNLIKQNNITGYGEDVATIYLDNSGSTTIQGNSLYPRGYYEYGIYNLQSDDSTISQNNFYTYSYGGAGAYIEESDRTNISNNYFEGRNKYAYSAQIYYFSDNTNFDGNTIYSFYNSSYGLVIEEFSHEGIYSNNIIETNSRLGLGILLDTSDSSTFISNQISTTGPRGYGIYFGSETYDNTFSNMQITTSGIDANAIHVSDSLNYFDVKDSILNSSEEGTKDIFIDNDSALGDFNFTNTSFSNIEFGDSASANLHKRWYLDLQVDHAENYPVEGTNVLISDSDNNTIFSGVTSEDGTISQREFPEYTQNSPNSKNYHSNYTILLSNSVESFLQTLNLTENSILSIIFVEIPLQTSLSSGGDQRSTSGEISSQNTEETCTPHWSCEKWTVCLNGIRTRTCENRNLDCDEKSPSLERKCVRDQRKVLFDINLEVLDSSLDTGDETITKIGLLNLGVPGKVHANVHYEITNPNDEIIYIEDEIIEVETQTEYLKTFNVSAVNGVYSIYADLTYDGQVEPAEALVTFRVGKNWAPLVWTIGIIFALAVLTITFRTFRRFLRKLGIRELDKVLDALDAREKNKNIPSRNL